MPLILNRQSAAEENFSGQVQAFFVEDVHWPQTVKRVCLFRRAVVRKDDGRLYQVQAGGVLLQLADNKKIPITLVSYPTDRW
jgi:hypothetical protein